MSLYKSIILVLLAIVILDNGCAKKDRLAVPEKISEKKITKLLADDEAVKIIDKLHGLEVAPEENIIAEYGEDPKDLLYISYYKDEDQARDAFKLMISKMMKTNQGPFTHIRALPNYREKVYMSIGMGAIHYIYYSSYYILWLQTYQDIGRELPEELLSLYPI